MNISASYNIPSYTQITPYVVWRVPPKDLSDTFKVDES